MKKNKAQIERETDLSATLLSGILSGLLSNPTTDWSAKDIGDRAVDILGEFDYLLEAEREEIDEIEGDRPFQEYGKHEYSVAFKDWLIGLAGKRDESAVIAFANEMADQLETKERSYYEQFDQKLGGQFVPSQTLIGLR